MAYAIELAEIRAYTHNFIIDTDDELAAQKLAEELAESVSFLDSIAGNGWYYGSELQVADVWEADNNNGHDEVLTVADIAKYTEE